MSQPSWGHGIAKGGVWEEKEEGKSGVVEEFTGHLSVYCIVVLCLMVEMAPWAVWIERASSYSFITPPSSLSIVTYGHSGVHMSVARCSCLSLRV